MFLVLENALEVVKTYGYVIAALMLSSLIILQTRVASAADTTPPTVAITSPSSGATVSGTILWVVSATDDVGIKVVQFMIDGNSYTADSASPYSVGIATTALSNGQHTLMAIAYDTSMNNAIQQITIYVNNGDTTPPTVSILSPANGATVSGTITVTASGSDVSGITKIEFFVDGILKGTDTTSPYSFILDTNTLTDISHILKVAAYDAYNNIASAQISVTVDNSASGDTTPPVVTPPPNQTVEATSASGRVVTFTATANDNVDGALTPVCTPASGSTFPLGTTTVSCSATDAAGNTGTAAFTVTVRDTTAPTLSLPPSLTAEATSASGRVVTFTATATDLVDGSRAVTCTPASGSTFPLGLTTVNCSTSDTRGNTRAGSFSVTIRDTTPPALTLPSNMILDATGPSGRTVTFTATATDLVDGSRPVTCTPASGSTFPISLTTVNCSASDTRANTATGSFTITVRDTTPPALTLPSAMTAEATSSSGAAVAFTATATDLVDGSRPVTCTPASGSTFPISLTTVNCSASDTRANTATGSFTITVRDTTAPAVSVTSPSDGSIVSSTITVSATATDKVAMSNVKLYVDGVYKGMDSASPYGFSLDTTAYANGQHAIQVMGWDSSTNMGSSQVVYVSVQNTSPARETIPPTVSITSPADGSTVTGTRVTVSVTASDASGIARVDIYVDGKLMATLSGAGPSYYYSMNVKKLQPGDHIITAIAYDINGNSASDSNTVTKVK